MKLEYAEQRMAGRTLEKHEYVKGYVNRKRQIAAETEIQWLLTDLYEFVDFIKLEFGYGADSKQAVVRWKEIISKYCRAQASIMDASFSSAAKQLEIALERVEKI